MLNINIWDIVWTVVNLLFFFIFLRIFLFKPVMKVMDERKQKIQDDLDSAQAAREESEGNAMIILITGAVTITERTGE